MTIQKFTHDDITATISHRINPQDGASWQLLKDFFNFEKDAFIDQVQSTFANVATTPFDRVILQFGMSELIFAANALGCPTLDDMKKIFERTTDPKLDNNHTGRGVFCVKLQHTPDLMSCFVVVTFRPYKQLANNYDRARADWCELVKSTIREIGKHGGQVILRVPIGYVSEFFRTIEGELNYHNQVYARLGGFNLVATELPSIHAVTNKFDYLPITFKVDK